MNKSQISLEILTVVGLISILFITFSIVAQNNNKNIERRKGLLSIRKDCMKIQSIASSIFASGEGSSLTFTINNDFDVYNNFLLFNYKGADIECTLPFNAIVNETFTLRKGRVSVKNEGNIIVMENVTALPEQPTPLNCKVIHSTSCSSGIKILVLSSDVDAHASYPGDNNFEYSLCCDIDDSTIKDGCSGNEVYLMSFTGDITPSPQDEHVGYDQDLYSNDICLIADKINYCMIKDSCDVAGEECVAEISDTTDAHIAKCGYGLNKKICCSLT